MKKILCLLFSGLLALSVLSCNDDKDATHIPSLSATPDKLNFAAAPEAPQTIAVKAEHVSWKATTEAKWLTLKDAEGTADGTIVVTAVANETTDVQNATIVISAEGVEDITIAVTQAGPVIWEKNSLSRMNLHGNVTGASILGNNVDDTFIYDLTFDTDGMLSTFNRKYSGNTVHFTLAYDGQKRLTKVTSDDFTIDFGYGDHGKYINTDNLFQSLAFLGYRTDYQVWLPRFIKNLTSVKAADSRYNDEYTIEVTGETGKILYDGTEQTLVFTGEYMSQCLSEGYFGATTETFEVDMNNGNLLLHKVEDGLGTLLRKYNNDRINSISEVTGGDIPMKAIYNENLDMTGVQNLNDASKNISMTYEYDAHKNWTEMTYSGAFTEVVTREVTYSE